MKYFLKNVFVFILVFILTYPLVVFICGLCFPKWINCNINYKFGASGFLFSRLKELEERKSVDVLCLGSSHTYRGFDPRIFKKYGITSFNLGSSAQTAIQTELLLDRYLNNINPKLVIYEVYPEIFSLDGVESALDIISNDDNDLASLKMAVELNHIKVYNTLIYSKIREWTHLNDRRIELPVKYMDKYIEGGFVEREMSYNSHLEFMPEKIELNDKQLKHFYRILSAFKSRNIPVLLVYAPVTSKYYSSISNKVEINKLFENNGNYINFNELMVLNDSLDFFDKDHLNQNGVEKFNVKLIELLNSKFPEIIKLQNN